MVSIAPGFTEIIRASIIPWPAIMEEFKKQLLTEHLADLRSCLIYAGIATGVGFAISYAFIKEVGSWFLKPLMRVLPEQTSLIFTSYQEAFFFI